MPSQLRRFPLPERLVKKFNRETAVGRVRVRVLVGALVAVALASTGCSSAPARTAQLSEDAVRLDLPLVRQDALHDCGLASLSALSAYWGVELSDEARAELAETAELNEGLSGDEIRAALLERGLDVYLFSGSLDRTVTGLYTHVDAGRPPLVMLSPDAENQHYGLVLGYDEPRGALIVLDPSRGEILASIATFERDWARCGNFTLLACRPATDRVASNTLTTAR
jgi:ABC-type bacteriocin/lantibiotic exporter with double-glycine peptidase domain